MDFKSNDQRSILYNSVTILVVQSVDHSVCVWGGGEVGGRRSSREGGIEIFFLNVRVLNTFSKEALQ